MRRSVFGGRGWGKGLRFGFVLGCVSAEDRPARVREVERLFGVEASAGTFCPGGASRLIMSAV